MTSCFKRYLRSFKDCSNKWREEQGLKKLDICDDGIGDIPGIIEKLNYIQEDIGVDIIWLNPIFDSPMEDFGYDVGMF